MRASTASAIAFLVFTALLALPAAAAADPLVVRTYDSLGVGAERLGLARDTARGILNAAGLDIAWRDCLAGCTDPVAAREVLVHIVAAPVGAARGSLGFAVVDVRKGSGTLATIYGDRVLAVAHRAGVDAATLLGRAIAHEIGHLVLGTARHAAAGLMRARWSDRELRQNAAPDWTFRERLGGFGPAPGDRSYR